MIEKTFSGISILLAVSSDGILFFQFMNGINDQTSVQLFLLDLATYLDKERPNWRQSHLLLMDNMSSHKTQKTLNMIEQLQLPVRFTAPASFLAVPVEGVFRCLKLEYFRLQNLPDEIQVKGIERGKLTKK